MGRPIGGQSGREGLKAASRCERRCNPAPASDSRVNVYGHEWQGEHSVPNRAVYRVPLRAERQACRSAAHIPTARHSVARSPSLPLRCQNKARENFTAPLLPFLAFLASSLQSPYSFLIPRSPSRSLPSSFSPEVSSFKERKASKARKPQKSGLRFVPRFLRRSKRQSEGARFHARPLRRTTTRNVGRR